MEYETGNVNFELLFVATVSLIFKGHKYSGFLLQVEIYCDDCCLFGVFCFLLACVFRLLIGIVLFEVIFYYI